jgi:hypothetical protein
MEFAGGLDLLVNCAGTSRPMPSEGSSTVLRHRLL